VGVNIAAVGAIPPLVYPAFALKNPVLPPIRLRHLFPSVNKTIKVNQRMK
jgi:hypothetical protein